MRHARIIALSAALFALPAVVSAHAFGQQYTLPIPASFFISGGMFAFVASCAVLLLLSEPIQTATRSMAVDARISHARVFLSIARVLAVAVLVCALLLAFFGAEDFKTNPLPNLFWVIFLLIGTYATAVIGGVWERIDPFRTIAAWFAPHATQRRMPRWFVYLPSICLLGLLWLELYSGGLGSIPRGIGLVLVAYVAISIVGSAAYGVHAWFRDADLFSTFFRLVGMAAPLQVGEGRISLSWPGERLVHEQATHIHALFFTLVLLGSTVLDGLRETQIWNDALVAVPLAWDNYIGTAMLVLLPIMLLACYMLAIAGMKMFSQTHLTVPELRLRFAYSLIPIAIAYHFAHYFSLIFSQGQVVIAQISDPFSRGWNLFGTAGYEPNIALIGADVVWYLQLSVIVLGHILAAVVAHRIARRVFVTEREIVVTQLPMLVLMVLFTALGLWTLSQPFMAG